MRRLRKPKLKLHETDHNVHTFASPDVFVGMRQFEVQKEEWLKARLAYHHITEKEAKKHCFVQEYTDYGKSRVVCHLVVRWTPWLQTKCWLRKRKR